MRLVYLYIPGENKGSRLFQVIEIPFSELPEGEEVLTILGQEQAPLHLWVTLAVEYYRQDMNIIFQ